MRDPASWSAVLVLGLALTSCVGKQPSFREPPPTSYSATRLQLEMDGASPTQVAGAVVTADFFRSADVRAMIGRLMIGPEYERTVVPVTVLSHHCWQEQFLSSPAVIGRRVTLDGRPTTIVGVAPPGFDVPKGTCFWLPRVPIASSVPNTSPQPVAEGSRLAQGSPDRG